MHFGNFADDRQQDVTPTTDENPIAITVVDRNGNADLTKVEQVKNENLNIYNDSETTT